MKRQPVFATCQHCGQGFVKNYQAEARRYCSRECSNSGRSRHVPDSAIPDTTDHDTDADYPGTEWGPLPPALLARVAAHVLAAEYAAWAAQQKAITP